MSVSGTTDTPWVERISGSQNRGPEPRELRLSTATQAKAKLVSASSGLMGALRYMRDHPLDFILSTAASMAMYMSVRSLVLLAFPAVGFGLAAAMVTSGIIGIGRGLYKELKERRKRVDALYQQDTPPTAADLARARSVDIADVIETGLQRALITGIISGLTGALLGEIVHHQHALDPTGYRTDTEYQNFLDRVGARESHGHYDAVNDYNYIGKYQFGEDTLIDTGYYARKAVDGSIVDTTSNNDWVGRWTGKDGILSKEDFLNTPAVQEKAVREAMALRWKEIVRLNLDDYVGKTIDNVPVTESGLLAGSWLKGVGSFTEVNGERVAQGGLAKFLTTGYLNPDANGTHILSYIKKFGGYNLPFAVDNPKELVDLVPVVDGICNTKIEHAWPLDSHATQWIESTYKWRWGKMHEGVDIAAVRGTPVNASAAGVVEFAGNENGYGNRVDLRHADGTMSRYAHLSEIDVSKGDTLKQGQWLGRVGSTGHSTGNHLHYELRDSTGHSFDPLPCLNQPRER